MNGASLPRVTLFLVLLLVLSGCGPEKPGMQTTPAPVVQPPSPPPDTPGKPETPPATPATMPTPTPTPPTPTAKPVTPPDPSPTTGQPVQPKAQPPATPAPPPAASPPPASAALGKAKVSKADNLFEKPFTDARVITRLNAGEEVALLQREGAWYLLRAAGQQGWMRMLSVRSTAPPAAAGAGSLGQVATGRAGTGQIVSTTGVRGLGEEQLKEAPFSEAAIAAAERFRVKPAAAEKQARAQGLAPRQVPPLPTMAAATDGGAP